MRSPFEGSLKGVSTPFPNRLPLSTTAIVRIFPDLGQSNNYFAPAPQGVVFADSVFQLRQDGTVENVAGQTSLDHVAFLADRCGPSLAHANRMAALYPNDVILRVPCALQSTGLSTEDWGVNDRLLMRAISRINTALAMYPTARIGQLCWSGLEAGSAGQLNYQQALDEFTTVIRRIRSRVTDQNLWPITIAGMVPEFIADPARTSAQQVQNALMQVPSLLPGTWAIDTATLTGLTDDSTHWNTAGALRMGEEQADARLLALANVDIAPKLRPVPVYRLAGGDLTVDLTRFLEFGTGAITYSAAGTGVVSCTSGGLLTVADSAGVVTASVTATNTTGADTQNVRVIVSDFDMALVTPQDVGAQIDLTEVYTDEQATVQARVGDAVAVAVGSDFVRTVGPLTDITTQAVLNDGPVFNGQSIVWPGTGSASNPRARVSNVVLTDTIARIGMDIEFGASYAQGTTGEQISIAVGTGTPDTVTRISGRYYVSEIVNGPPRSLR